MKDLSEHITDIAQNSTRAEATLVEIHIKIHQHTLSLHINDNGRGMSQEILQSVSDPFTTTRTTRKVGLGLPFLKQNAEQTGGSFHIQSQPQKGTQVKALFHTQHWDMLPLGDIPFTISLLIGGNPNTDFAFTYQKDNNEPFSLLTTEVKEMLPDVSLADLSVIKMLKELIANNIE